MATILKRESLDIVCLLIKEPYYAKGIKPEPIQGLDSIINIL